MGDLERFVVWDECNSSEEHALKIDAWCAVDAAEKYAEEDVDGNCDGIYLGDRSEPIWHDLKNNGQVICVRCPDGSLKRFAVGIVEFEPVYGSAELPEKDGET